MLAQSPGYRVKVFGRGASDDAATQLRFLANARRLADVRHENLGQTLRVEQDADGRVEVVRRHEPGRTLTELLRAATPDTDWACSVLLGVLEGLAALHDRGLCHGNLKPNNVIVDAHQTRPRVRLVDMGFGIVGGPDDDTRFLNPDTRFVSPEALLGRPSSPSSDLFAAAVLLYEMLAGEAIVDSADDGLEAFRAVASDTLEPLCQRNPRVAEPLARAIETCLCANPDERLASARAFARQIAPYAAPEVSERFLFASADGDVEEAVTPSLHIRRAPRPRRDLACPEDMLLEPALPRLRSSALLEELRDEVELCPPSETEGFVSAPPLPEATPPEGRTALFAVGTGASLGALLAWLNAVM